jgi:hypothetical protein
MLSSYLEGRTAETIRIRVRVAIGAAGRAPALRGERERRPEGEHPREEVLADEARLEGDVETVPAS